MWSWHVYHFWKSKKRVASRRCSQGNTGRTNEKSAWRKRLSFFFPLTWLGLGKWPSMTVVKAALSIRKRKTNNEARKTLIASNLKLQLYIIIKFDIGQWTRAWRIIFPHWSIKHATIMNEGGKLDRKEDPQEGRFHWKSVNINNQFRPTTIFRGMEKTILLHWKWKKIMIIAFISVSIKRNK